DQIVVERPLLACGLDVHDRAFTGDGDRFGEGADLQLSVHRRDEIRGQLEPVTSEGVEPGQREGDRVDAGPQIENAVLPAAVGDGRAYFLDQHRARGFDSDARQDSAGAVLDYARNRRLDVPLTRRRRSETKVPGDQIGTAVLLPAIATLTVQCARSSGG